MKKPDWDKSDGLLPAIVQDVDTGQVLMLGYMNRTSLQKTQETGLVTFFSRSRQQLWTKGETSGNTLESVSINLDCDQDTLLVMARPNGPTCHKGWVSCFGELPPPGTGWLGQLARIIHTRRETDPDTSYTAKLLQGPASRAAQKVGEEGVEVALAAATGDMEGLLSESADLIYHLSALLARDGKSIADVVDVLRERHKQA